MTCPSADETRARMAALGRKGGLAATSQMTPEERSARMSAASKARWAKENARRAAEGREPTKSWVSPLEGEDLDEWLRELDEQNPAARGWTHEQRRRQALVMLRKAIADATVDAMNRGER